MTKHRRWEVTKFTINNSITCCGFHSEDTFRKFRELLVDTWYVYLAASDITTVCSYRPYHSLKDVKHNTRWLSYLSLVVKQPTSWRLQCDGHDGLKRGVETHYFLAFILNNTLILCIWCTTIPHLPGCCCPWTFFQNIGFYMVPSDPFMSHIATQLGYYAGEFPACWSTFWKSIFKHQLGCRFDILDSISSYFCISTYAIIYVLIHHIIFGFIFTS